MRLSQPIFVVGCPRSGTTLVQCILSASSQAFSFPETHFFSWVLPSLGVGPHARITPEQLRVARAELEHEAQLMLPDHVWLELEARGDLRALDVFLAAVACYCPGGDLRAIEKTPRHVLHLETIGEVFPDARFVNIVRDPIDVASSLLRMPFESSRSMLSYAQRWMESIQAARAYARAHPDRLHTVTYELLVREPEAQVRRLCAFLDLPYEAAMLNEFGREAARNVGRSEDWKRDIERGVIVDRKGVWRTRMTPGGAWLVAQATRPHRREYGYVDRPVATPGSIAAAIVREARIRFGEARPSTGIIQAARHAGSVLKTLSVA